MQAEGFWLKGDFLAKLSISTSHIGCIRQKPDLFEITTEEINKTYKKYNERPGKEGKARAEIIKKATENGWIRIRHYLKPVDYWSIQFDEYKKNKEKIENFINNYVPEYNTVKLVGFKDEYNKVLDLFQENDIHYKQED